MYVEIKKGREKREQTWENFKTKYIYRYTLKTIII